MKKFFGSAQTLFLLLLLLNKVLPLTATTNEIELIVSVYNSDLRKTDIEQSFHDISLTNKQDYINQFLKVLKKRHPNTDFFFPWEEKKTGVTHQFELNALARSSFPITKQCPKKLFINLFKEGTFTQNLRSDPVTFFQQPENWRNEWGEPEVDSATASTVSKNEPPLQFTTGNRAGTDSHTDRENDANTENNSNKVSKTDQKEEKKGGGLLKYGGALLLVSILARGCYALYRSVTSQKGGESEQEEEQEEEAACYL